MLPSSIKVLFSAAALAGACKAKNETEPEQPAPVLSWDGWADLVPSKDLNYTSCYEGRLKCTKLTVPIDWLNPEAETKTKVHIALAVLPAVVDEDDESFGGTILINPGGPAGSGTDQVAQGGAEIQRIADGDKKFAVMGFDPRGVGQTDPPADCWRDPLYRLFYDREDRALGDPIRSDESLHMALARAEGFSKRCEQVGEEADYDILEYMSTSSVARDMIHIADKMEELRTGKTIDDDTAEEDKPRVLYWGLSYGTVLGNYLASMFPGRMERVLLEAVVDVHDYYEGQWLKNLQDTDKVYEYVWDSCYAAGEACALVESGDSSGDDIRKRFEAWLEELNESPEVVVQDHTIYTVTGYDILTPFFGAAIYSPTLILPTVMGAIAQMMAGDYTILSTLSPIPGSSFTCSDDPIPNQFLWATEAQRAIGCGDAVDLSNTTFSDVKENIDTLKEQSPLFATFWSRIRIPCSSWNYRPEYRFTGPWETPEADPDRVKGKPTAPILWLSSEYDPVTPLKNAHEMAKYHPGSVVLALDNYGHGNTGLPSACRDKWVKRYWQEGKMPPKDTMCETDCKAFEECDIPGAEALQSPLQKRTPLGF